MPQKNHVLLYVLIHVFVCLVSSFMCGCIVMGLYCLGAGAGCYYLFVNGRRPWLPVGIGAIIAGATLCAVNLAEGVDTVSFTIIKTSIVTLAFACGAVINFFGCQPDASGAPTTQQPIEVKVVRRV